MAGKSNKHYRSKLDLVLVCCMSSSLSIASLALPLKVSANPLLSKRFIIAKPPDERQPEAVEKAIEQIPITQPPASQEPKQAIESPIPPASPSSGTVESTPAPKPSGTVTTPEPVESTPAPKPSGTVTTPKPVESTPAPKPSGTVTTPEPVESTPAPKPSGTVTTPKPVESTPAPKPSGTVTTPSIEFTPAPQPSIRPSTPQRQGGRKPSTTASPASRFNSSNFQEINFVDIAPGVLAPRDYKFKGRYYHFYQFEGQANQLIQIRLSGSIDRRRSNNLSLDPFMLLLDPNNNVLLTRGSDSINTQRGKDAFVFVRLPVKGTYTIAVTSRKPGETGRYSLAIRNDRASYTLDEARTLTQNNPTLKQTGSPYNVSQLQGEKDQLVSIRVDSLFEEFSPYVVLLNSKGQIIAADNDRDGRYSALIDRARLPEDGTYYIVVISADARQRGRYRLTVF
jgi:hypothetical protein